MKYHFSKQHQFNPKYSIIIINTIKISIISVIFRDAWCHPRPMNETKISNAATGQAKLFLCALALLTRGRKPDSPGKIYNSTSNPEERIKTTQFMCNINNTENILGKCHKRENEPMTFRVLSGGQYKLKVKMGTFGAEMRNSNPKN